MLKMSEAFCFRQSMAWYENPTQLIVVWCYSPSASSL